MSGGLRTVLRAGRAWGARRVVGLQAGPQGQESRLFLVVTGQGWSEGPQHQAEAPGSFCAGNWDPHRATRQVWGAKDAPECMEPCGLPEAAWERYL